MAADTARGITERIGPLEPDIMRRPNTGGRTTPLPTAEPTGALASDDTDECGTILPLFVILTGSIVIVMRAGIDSIATAPPTPAARSSVVLRLLAVQRSLLARASLLEGRTSWGRQSSVPTAPF